MLNYFKKIPFFLLAIFILTAVFFSGSAEASFWDMIKAWVTINPLVVDVSAPKEVEIDKVFRVKARVINKGGEKIENVKGEIFLPQGLDLLQKDSVQKIGVIPGKKEKKISWPVKGEKEGSYIVSVEASGELKGQIIRAEGNTLVEIKESLRKTGPRDWLQNFFDFFQKLF